MITPKMPLLSLLQKIKRLSLLTRLISVTVIVIVAIGSFYLLRHSTDCNIASITLHGELVAYNPAGQTDTASAEDIVRAIEDARKNRSVKAIVLLIDSSGGSLYGGTQIMDALASASKPTVALVEDMADSAAYEAALGANAIFASKNSEVGSIGVTISYLENVAKDQQDGIQYMQLSSGKYKDMLSPDKPLTPDERALVMRDVNIIAENFMRTVSERRKLPLEKVRALADGSAMLGEMALQNGLTDYVGGLKEARAYLANRIGSKAIMCEE